MGRRKQALHSAELDALGERIEQWRNTRTNMRTPMPSELWEEASRLAKTHGVYPVSRDLGLSYEKLKRRAEPSPSRRGRKKRAANFVELDSTQVIGVSDSSELKLELVNSGGGKMTVELNVGSLVKSFFRY